MSKYLADGLPPQFENAAVDVSRVELNLRQAVFKKCISLFFRPLTFPDAGQPCPWESRRSDRPDPWAAGARNRLGLRRAEQRHGGTHVDQHDDRRRPGETAHAKGRTLDSRRVAALPILDRFLKRLRIEEFLRDHLPHEDRRSRVPTATALLLLARNLLVSREPLYGIGEWAARHEPQLLGLSQEQLPALNDDRAGRALDRLFDADVAALALDVAAHAVSTFDVALDQLHNDSTTVTFHGDYEGADRERTLRGRLRLAVTHGHNKDHRPDLKQLLYILTVSGDGAVPVHFRVESGNATDDRSHTATWDLLCKLTGRRDFLYVADCKLATAENMAHIHQHGGRFLSVLPRTRGEDSAFRAAVVRGQVAWRPGGPRRPVLDLRAGGAVRRGLPADLVPQPTQGRTGRGGAAEADCAGGGATG